MKLMKKMSLLLLALVLMVGILLINAPEAQAAEIVASGTCGDNVTYTLAYDAETEEHILTISGTGAMYDYGSTYSNHILPPWCDYATSITSVVIDDGVTGIGTYAFCEHESLINVTIPDSVTSIGERAFMTCFNMSAIDLPDNLSSIGEGVFSHCMGLTAIELPEGIDCIPGGAFSFSGLTRITIPEGVTSIGRSAFSDCNALSRVELPDSVTSIAVGAFQNSMLSQITIPAGVTSIEEQTFYGCANLSSIEIPAGVTSIGDRAFYMCMSLTDITIPAGVTSIGSQAFESCSSLKSINIPESVTGIGSSAFAYCSSLKSITIPEEVTSIEGYMFCDCWELTSIAIPVGVTSIGDDAFYNCSNLTNVYYGGTEEQWAAISIGSYNEELTNATIHYTEAEPEVTPLAIVTQPADQTVAYGETAQFAVEATGAASYAWQYSKNGTTWYATKLTGFDTAALSVPMTTNRSGYQYRCRLTGEDGSVLYTDAVTLTMAEAKPGYSWLSYDGDPLAGGTTFAQVMDAQNIAGYQWQYCKSQEAAKEGAWFATSLTGNNTDTLTIEGHPGREGYLYRCKLTGYDGTVIYTDTVVLNVASCITTQPADQNVLAVSATANFALVAQNVASYQWQYKNNKGGSWCNTKMTGYDSEDLLVDVNQYRDGYQYRCKLTLTNGAVVYTDAATLSIMFD